MMVEYTTIEIGSMISAEMKNNNNKNPLRDNVGEFTLLEIGTKNGNQLFWIAGLFSSG